MVSFCFPTPVKLRTAGDGKIKREPLGTVWASWEP